MNVACWPFAFARLRGDRVRAALLGEDEVLAREYLRRLARSITVTNGEAVVQGNAADAVARIAEPAANRAPSPLRQEFARTEWLASPTGFEKMLRTDARTAAATGGAPPSPWDLRPTRRASMPAM